MKNPMDEIKEEEVVKVEKVVKEVIKPVSLTRKGIEDLFYKSVKTKYQKEYNNCLKALEDAAKNGISRIKSPYLVDPKARELRKLFEKEGFRVVDSALYLF